ncbi:MAG: redoxin domain-containing protein [Clostridium sp.]|nr:redoxin domain-containing protein [Clostridium sp.]
MKKNHSILLIAAAAMTLVSSCAKNDSWRLEGTLQGGADKELIVENLTFVGWTGVDTVTLDSRGHFSVEGEPKGYPEIYRARIDGHTLYFPIDSVETVTVAGNLDDLEGSYTLEGTTDGEMLVNAERRINRAIAELGPDGALTDSLLKRDLANIVLTRPESVVSFYLLNKTINNRSLFNMANSLDMRILGAVANAYKEMRPNDPRTARLGDLFIQVRNQNSSGSGRVVEAVAIGLQDIDLYDEQGNRRLLSDVAAGNRVVVLNFTTYEAEESPAFNIELNKFYSAARASGVEIYQVACDDNDLAWRQAAENLPWVTVRNSGADAASNLMKYNVGGLPTTYLIVDGEVVDRVDDITNLQQVVARHR